MDILGFVNSNGTLCTVLGSIFSTLITAIVAIVIDNRKSKVDSIQTLKKELAEKKQELEDTRQKLAETQAVVDSYKNIEKEEANIDKSTGAIYVETLPNGNRRSICGYCWENGHKRLPLIMSNYYDDDERMYMDVGYCASCNSRCYEK